MPATTSHAIEHLVARLRPLHEVLSRAVAKRDRVSEILASTGARSDVITRSHVDAILVYVHKLPEHLGLSVGAPPAREESASGEAALRAAAGDQGIALPLDALAAALDLSDFEQEAVVLCAAAEVDPSYGVIFAFLQDDQTARSPSVDLVAALTAPDLATLADRRAALGVYGRLRRRGVIAARARGGSQLTAELMLTPAAAHFLLGGGGDPATLFQDPAEISQAGEATAPSGIDLERCMKTAKALAEGTIDTIGVFGGREAARREVVVYMASRTGHPLRRLRPGEDAGTALETAAALSAVLWIDVDCLEEAALSPCGPLMSALAVARVPVLLTGYRPWRPTRVLEGRAYIELEVGEVPIELRADLWQQELEELTDDEAADLAARFRFAASEIRAAAAIARSTARALANGRGASAADTIDEACAAIARPVSLRYGVLVEPRRTRHDLVLPARQRAQLDEVVRHYRHAPRVLGDWQFRSRLTSAGGVRALFAGDPGTGKTLAAEVIAGEIGLPLLKIDLARVVSKWVGETEKNLDAAFREAEDSHAVLFFDEAEALFGARGEVQRGSDRYANLEVSFLLQRLDSHGGVAILATNLRDRIDPAFGRRFEVMIAFPRPEESERRQLWRLAVPTPEGRELLADDVDLGELARFELTGAGIFAAAQTAAFLAASEGAERISMAHLVRGLARQFQREARVLTAADLGRHGALLERM